jgi:hypothetical protein
MLSDWPGGIDSVGTRDPMTTRLADTVTVPETQTYVPPSLVLAFNTTRLYVLLIPYLAVAENAEK